MKVNIKSKRNEKVTVAKRIYNFGTDYLDEDLDSLNNSEYLDDSILRILFIACNPSDAVRIRVDKEVKAIRGVLKSSIESGRVIFQQHSAVTPQELQVHLLDVNPHILHISAHGGSEGLTFEDIQGNSCVVSDFALISVVQLISALGCVILNSCFSDIQGMKLVKIVPHVIGCYGGLLDEVAIIYSEGFYRAVSKGQSFIDAHEFGLSAGLLSGYNKKDLPHMCKSATQKG